MLAGFPHSLLTSTGPSKDRFPPAPTYGFGWGKGLVWGKKGGSRGQG